MASATLKGAAKRAAKGAAKGQSDGPSLARAIRQALAAQANAAQAAPMQAYMKSTLPFHGVAAPLRRQIVKAHAAALPATEAPVLQVVLKRVLLSLWRQASHREDRYAALDLLRLPRLQRLIDLWLLPVLKEMVETGPWWDHNDEISGHALALLLQQHPKTLKPLMRQWARSDQLWQRRAAMLCQRSIKGPAFDAVLFYDCILPSLAAKGAEPLAGEFFIRKGMGWALRERSYAAAEEVLAFCDEYAAQISPLTRREALKHLRRTERAA